MSLPVFYTEHEISKVLKVSKPALRLWRRQGMPARHFKRCVRYELEKVLEWLEQEEKKKE